MKINRSFHALLISLVYFLMLASPALANVKDLLSEIQFLTEDAYNLAKKSSDADNLEQAHMYAQQSMKSAESARNAAEAALAEYAEPNKRADDIPFLE